jgi:hypothetical protein
MPRVSGELLKTYHRQNADPAVRLPKRRRALHSGDLVWTCRASMAVGAVECEDDAPTTYGALLRLSSSKAQ